MTAVDIHAFNLARVAEDETGARAAIWQRWSWDGHLPHVDTAEPVPHPILGDKPARVANCYLTTGKAETEARHAAHIARHDPARVLREVAAKRRVLERHRPASHPNYRFYDTDPIVYTCVGCGYDTNSCGEHEPRTEDINDCPELRDIAAIYADHEDYAPKWSETP